MGEQAGVRRMLLGAVLLAALASTMLLGAGLGAPDAATLGLLLVLLPALAAAQARLIDQIEIERMAAYVSSFFTLLVLGAGCLAVGARVGGPAAVGFVRLPAGALVAWSAGLSVAGVGLMLGFRWVGERLGLSETPVLMALLPKTPRERQAFVGLSIAAGAGEEIAYRGYAITALAPLVGPLGGAVVSSAVFGLLHAYQGPLGIARTACLGGVLAWGLLASGSLWPPLIAHAVLDVVAGILIPERLVVRPAPRGVGA